MDAHADHGYPATSGLCQRRSEPAAPHTPASCGKQALWSPLTLCSPTRRASSRAVPSTHFAPRPPHRPPFFSSAPPIGRVRGRRVSDCRAGRGGGAAPAILVSTPGGEVVLHPPLLLVLLRYSDSCDCYSYRCHHHSHASLTLLPPPARSRRTRSSAATRCCRSSRTASPPSSEATSSLLGRGTASHLSTRHRLLEPRPFFSPSGDALVFQSHKQHGVAALTGRSSRRNIMVRD